nr:hypothetical protein [Nanoarchaeum sp.]
MDSIENILKAEYPGLNVDVVNHPINSDITQEELVKALHYIKEYRLIEDSTSLLSQITPSRTSVTYPMFSQPRELNFRVDWVQGPMVVVGYIESKGKLGENITQVRLYNMYLK